MKILEQRLQKEWAKIVGSSIASHTRPESIKFRKLILVAENSAWLQQLVFLKPMILEKLHEFDSDAQILDIIPSCWHCSTSSADERFHNARYPR